MFVIQNCRKSEVTDFRKQKNNDSLLQMFDQILSLCFFLFSDNVADALS